MLRPAVNARSIFSLSLSSLWQTRLIFAASIICALGSQGKDERIKDKILIGLVVMAACSGVGIIYYCHKRRACCFRAASCSQDKSVSPVLVGQEKTDLSVRATEGEAHDEPHTTSDPKLFARKDRERIPPGMALIEIKDRTEGDTAEEMVLELYRSLPNGTERGGRMQANLTSDNRIVLVPASDVHDLHQAWHIKFKEARRQVEVKLQRRATRLLFFARGEDGAAVKVDVPGSIADSQSTSASSTSARGDDA